MTATGLFPPRPPAASGNRAADGTAWPDAFRAVACARAVSFSLPRYLSLSLSLSRAPPAFLPSLSQSLYFPLPPDIPFAFIISIFFVPASGRPDAPTATLPSDGAHGERRRQRTLARGTQRSFAHGKKEKRTRALRKWRTTTAICTRRPSTPTNSASGAKRCRSAFDATSVRRASRSAASSPPHRLWSPRWTTPPSASPLRPKCGAAPGAWRTPVGLAAY